MTINNLFKRAIKELKNAGIQTPELDARVLLSHALDKDSVFLLTHSEEFLTNREYSKFRRYVRRRKKLEPIAYILGYKEFFGYNFHVNKNVLIPRPETEFLVEKALEIIKEIKDNKLIRIIDIGTGSGCIIESVALKLKDSEDTDRVKLYATDNSKKALNVAKKNARLHSINKKIRFFNSDLFSNKRLPKDFDIVIANLPYVPIETKTSKLESIDFEPHNAIFAANNGTHAINRLIGQLKSIKFNYCLLETDGRNIKSIAKEANDHGFATITYRDIEIERFLLVQH